jgi:hypothetical protein
MTAGGKGNNMSMVIVNIEDDDLDYSYQLCKDEDDTYYLYKEASLLKGRTVFKGVEDIREALRLMMDYVYEYEGITA